MGSVQVTVTFDLPAFSPTSGRKFTKHKEGLDSVVQTLSSLTKGNRTWAYQNFRINSAAYVPDEGEVERYRVEDYGFKYVVRDYRPDSPIHTSEVAFGPSNEFACKKVCELLQAIEDHELWPEQPTEEVTDDYGDPDAIPF